MEIPRKWVQIAEKPCSFLFSRNDRRCQWETCSFYNKHSIGAKHPLLTPKDLNILRGPLTFE